MINNIYMDVLLSFIDIFLVTCIIYWFLKLILQSEKMIFIFNAIVMFFILYGISSILKLTLLNSLLENFYSWGIILLFIIFQNEIKAVLEQLGDLKSKSNIKSEETNFIEDFVETLFTMANEKVGALVTFEQNIPLTNYTSKAILIDAHYSSQLLYSIFNKEAPIHDGAVVMKNERIKYASTYYPIDINTALDKKFGTRHRAAMTISKETDSITIIVSEERGEVSIAYKENLYNNLEYDFVVEYLKNKLEVKVDK